MMRDCPNSTMRERLPDLLHDRLSAAERAEVHAHLNECAECRAELALLQRVRSATMSPRIDTARIAAAIPSYRGRSQWRRFSASAALRIAAVLVLVLGGFLLLRKTRVQVEEPRTNAPIVLLPTPPVTPAPTPVEARRSPAPPAAPTELAVGELFDDLTDNELRSLLEALGKVEAVTPVETEVVIPAVNREGF